MGWGLSIDNVYLSKVSRRDIDDNAEENDKLIGLYKNQMVALATHNFTDSVIDGELYESAQDRALDAAMELFEEMEEAISDRRILWKLRMRKRKT